ncbi:MAG: ester cyclase [Thermomicrobia bacterium]|nr:ester cyclase [Thermomicrobia bacterium]MCA1723770.1 ester cyclase [Thermomicrobia bacterium]
MVEQVYNRGDLATIDDFFAPDFARHRAGGPGATGTDAMKQYIAGIRTVFPDLRISADVLIGEGERVMARLTAHATHRAPFMGIAATIGR